MTKEDGRLTQTAAELKQEYLGWFEYAAKSMGVNSEPLLNLLIKPLSGEVSLILASGEEALTGVSFHERNDRDSYRWFFRDSQTVYGELGINDREGRGIIGTFEVKKSGIFRTKTDRPAKLKNELVEDVLSSIVTDNNKFAKEDQDKAREFLARARQRDDSDYLMSLQWSADKGIKLSLEETYRLDMAEKQGYFRPNYIAVKNI